MDIHRAKEIVYDCIKSMISEGIDISIKSSKGKESPDIVRKYGNRSDRLPVEEWKHITFFPKSQEEMDRIYSMSMGLASIGIVFDTGGCAGKRDWEIDWSFHLDSDVDATIERRKIVEDIKNKGV